MNIRLAAFLLAVTSTLQAQTVADPTLSAAQRWVGRALILRGFYAGNELYYDASGKVEGTPKSVDWTLAGVDLDAVKRVDAETIELDGLRVAIRYNPDNLLFERRPQKDQHVKILVGIRKSGSSATTLLSIEPIEETLGEIFAIGIDPALQRSMPDFWQHYFNPGLPWPNDELNGQTIYDAYARPPVPGLVAPPVLHDPFLPETSEAESDKVRATVVLRVVVDPQGHLKRIAIARPLGYGLDARAALAARDWIYPLWQLNESPVPVRMNTGADFIPGKATAH